MFSGNTHPAQPLRVVSPFWPPQAIPIVFSGPYVGEAEDEDVRVMGVFLGEELEDPPTHSIHPLQVVPPFWIPHNPLVVAKPEVGDAGEEEVLVAGVIIEELEVVDAPVHPDWHPFAGRQ
ncbi:hypothetical protein RUND412_004952 [Rhizina undulata]